MLCSSKYEKKLELQYMISKAIPRLVKDMEVNIESLKEFVISNNTNRFHVSEYYKYIGLSNYSYLIDEAEEKMMNLIRLLGLSYRMGQEGYLYYIIVPDDVFSKWLKT